MALPACKLAARLDRRKSPCTSSLGDVLCACVCLCDSTASPPYRGTLHVSMTPTSDANRSPARSPTPNRSKGRGQTKSDPKPAPGDLHRRSPTDWTTCQEKVVIGSLMPLEVHLVGVKMVEVTPYLYASFLAVEKKNLRWI